MAIGVHSSSVLSSQAGQATQKAMAQASSGLRINSAGDAAAGQAIAQGLNTQVRGQGMALRNLGDAMSLLQTRSGQSSQVTEQLQRMRELSIQANNSLYGPAEQQALNKEFTALRDGIQAQLNGAEFNGQALFGRGEQRLQVGAQANEMSTIEANDLPQQLNDLGFASLSLVGGNSNDLLNAIDASLAAVAQSQIQDAAQSNGLQARAEQLQRSRIDSSASLSRIQDLDYAKMAAELATAKTQEQAQIMVKAQANANQGMALRLLTG